MSNAVTDLFNMTQPEKEKYDHLVKELGILGIESPNICYQCSKCTSGCEAMKLLELKPHEIMASAKTGFIEEIVQSEVIWECIGCYKCKERCPQKMSPVDVIYVIKNWSVASGKQLPEEYQKMLQGILSAGHIQSVLDVRDKNNQMANRTSLGLPEFKGPKNQQKFTKAISELAVEGLKDL